MKMLVLITQLGITMLVPIIGCTIGFAWLGKRMDIQWLAVVGFAIGAIAGMRSCFRIIKRMTADWPREGGYGNESLEKNK